MIAPHWTQLVWCTLRSSGSSGIRRRRMAHPPPSGRDHALSAGAMPVRTLRPESASGGSTVGSVPNNSTWGNRLRSGGITDERRRGMPPSLLAGEFRQSRLSGVGRKANCDVGQLLGRCTSENGERGDHADEQRARQEHEASVKSPTSGTPFRTWSATKVAATWAPTAPPKVRITMFIPFATPVCLRGTAPTIRGARR